MLLLIALTSCATIALGVIALAQRPPNPARARARALGDEAGALEPPADQPFTSRVIRPIADKLLKSLPHRWLQRLEKMLVAAGEPVDPGLFVLLWAIIGFGAAGWSMLRFGLIGLLLGGGLGFGLPYLWLRRMVSRRRNKITRALPDAIDLLVTCVEAGLGLDAALIRVGDMTAGPLGAEIQRTLREIAVGRPRQEALLDLAIRPAVPDLDNVIRPIVQAERSGVSIGNALRVQAEALRTRRRQRAQDAAHKIPAKMAMVIAAFFIPTVMLIAVAPAVFSLVKFFSSGWV